MKEKAAFHVNGYLGLLGAIIIGLISLWLMFVGFTRNFPVILTIGIILFLIVILFSTSLTIIQPNEAKVLTFFGNYIGKFCFKQLRSNNTIIFLTFNANLKIYIQFKHLLNWQ